MPHTLAALGLSADHPVAWRALALMDGPSAYHGVASNIAVRAGRDGPEFLLVALSPEGNAALAKMLGLNLQNAGWVRWSCALDEAQGRGLCFVHDVPRADGRHFVVTKPQVRGGVATTSPEAA